MDGFDTVRKLHMNAPITWDGMRALEGDMLAMLREKLVQYGGLTVAEAEAVITKESFQIVVDTEERSVDIFLGPSALALMLKPW